MKKLNYLALFLCVSFFGCRSDQYSIFTTADLKFKAKNSCAKKYKSHLATTCKYGVDTMVRNSLKLLNKDATFEEAYNESMLMCSLKRFKMSKEACEYGVNKFVDLAIKELGLEGAKELRNLNKNFIKNKSNNINDGKRDSFDIDFSDEQEKFNGHEGSSY